MEIHAGAEPDLQPLEEPHAGTGGCLKDGCEPLLKQIPVRVLQTHGERSSHEIRFTGKCQILPELLGITGILQQETKERQAKANL
ncbi:hypothetical protein WISP_78455 [Willisornis vidua]|uniref:Uncharacterized protein n=1 Tax=Willisornis vidua TaxID=1566151 RepID=A0ABQ9D5E7_9PASS|nr:hypothetical protein WISP_78455 [Willisornis vidua]